MKRLLSIALLLVGMTSHAQTWKKTVVPGDELKGTGPQTWYRYENKDGTMLMAFHEEDDSWKVGVVRNSFVPDKNVKVHKITKNFIIYATIGFYNEHDQLVTKWTNCMMELPNDFRVAQTSVTLWSEKTVKGCREVVPYLLNEKGYVRILLPTYLGDGFDLKVPCLHNNNEQQP